MAEEIEAGTSVHLSPDPLGAGVDAFGVAVAVGQGKAGVHDGSVDDAMNRLGLHRTSCLVTSTL